MSLSAALVAAGAIAIATAAGAAEQVSIPHGDTTLPGVLFRPEGPGPFPGVVALHGCGGMVNSAGKILGRLADWGERLSAAGFAVLFPDSFTPRGLSGQCRVRERRVATFTRFPHRCLIPRTHQHCCWISAFPGHARLE